MTIREMKKEAKDHLKGNWRLGIGAWLIRKLIVPYSRVTRAVFYRKLYPLTKGERVKVSEETPIKN